MAFKRACYAVVKMDGGEVRRFDSDTVTRNYYSAVLETRTDRVSVLCNVTYPYLAFISADLSRHHTRDWSFVYPLNFAAQFEALTQFVPLDANWLMSELDPDMLVNLGKGEIRDIKYFEPAQVGDLIFNHWG